MSRYDEDFWRSEQAEEVLREQLHDLRMRLVRANSRVHALDRLSQKDRSFDKETLAGARSAAETAAKEFESALRRFEAVVLHIKEPPSEPNDL